MTWITELARLCPPPADTPPAINWPEVESTLGMRLPADYKEIADTYGPGVFCGYLHLYHPHGQTPWVNLTGPMPATLRTQLEETPDRDHSRAPYAPQNLFAIGVTDNGEYLFWITDPQNAPDTWHITVNEARGTRWYTHDGTLTQFLTAVISGRTSVPMFPKDLLDQRPAFTPSTPATPQPPPSPAQSPNTPTPAQDVRAWARNHGYNVPDRGRIPADIVDAWKKSNPPEPQ
ncbi:Lsr2 family protein [Streptomyces sp. JV176]|uniref:Lsr2 family DNA-binding protein n=1 Tax=Streptomyces sp. JV176 TaxID=858630 RepID=UPI002E76A740|nr:histone-like nucleoid-structuring protein Lsr2 [Streptomyces sp. JV176]MEE1798154.1 Lsr2 family protein [Streptomyces sp. JV176]